MVQGRPTVQAEELLPQLVRLVVDQTAPGEELLHPRARQTIIMRSLTEEEAAGLLHRHANLQAFPIIAPQDPAHLEAEVVQEAEALVVAAEEVEAVEGVKSTLT